MPPGRDCPSHSTDGRLAGPFLLDLLGIFNLHCVHPVYSESAWRHFVSCVAGRRRMAISSRLFWTSHVLGLHADTLGMRFERLGLLLPAARNCRSNRQGSYCLLPGQYALHTCVFIALAGLCATILKSRTYHCINGQRKATQSRSNGSSSWLACHAFRHLISPGSSRC